MKIKEYFDIELKVAIINVIIGSILGYVSFVVNVEPLINLAGAVAVYAVLYYIGKKKNFKSTNVALFFLSWIIVWTLFYNTRLG